MPSPYGRHRPRRTMARSETAAKNSWTSLDFPTPGEPITVNRWQARSRLAVASHHRGIDTPAHGLGTRPNPEEAVGDDRFVLSLEREGWDRFGGDRVAKQPFGGLPHQDLARLGRLLEAGGDVDRVPRDQRLSVCRVAGHHLPGVDACSGEDPEPAVPLELLVQPVESLPPLQGCPPGPKGVVLVQDGDAEHRHNGVADELLHGPAVRFERSLHLLEVAGHDPAKGFGIQPLAEARGAGDVGEHDGDHLADLALLRDGFEGPAAGGTESGTLRVVFTAMSAQWHLAGV